VGTLAHSAQPPAGVAQVLDGASAPVSTSNDLELSLSNRQTLDVTASLLLEHLTITLLEPTNLNGNQQ
jgi:hypothetical protein